MKSNIKTYIVASVVALCAIIGPAAGMASAQGYYNGRPTFIDRIFGNGYNYGNYGNYGYNNYNNGFNGFRQCGNNGWGNGNGWGNNGWHNGWRHHHRRWW